MRASYRKTIASLVLLKSYGHHPLSTIEYVNWKDDDMALLDEIKADQLAARKLNDRLKADVLTTLIGEATQITTEEFKRGVTEVTDEKVVATVAKFVKNTKLTLENLATERARLIEAGGDASKMDQGG